MKNLLKYSMVAGAAMTLAGSVYALPTVVITDGTAALNFQAVDSLNAGTFTASTSGDGWNVVATIGETEPPGPGGTAALPSIDISITAVYVGGAGTSGNQLQVFWGGGSFGPSSASYVATLTGSTLNAAGVTLDYKTFSVNAGAAPVNSPVTGPYLPSPNSQLTSAVLAPVPIAGGDSSYANTTVSAHEILSSYGLVQQVVFAGTETPGVTYSLDGSLTAVPDGGTTLMLLGSALSGLALLKKKLA